MKTLSNEHDRVRVSPRRAIGLMVVLSLGALALGGCDDEAAEAAGEPSLAPGDADLACLGLSKEACAARPSCGPVFGRTSRQIPIPQTAEERGVETDDYKYLFCWPNNCSYGLAWSCMKSADGSQCLLVDGAYSGSACSDDDENHIGGWRGATCGEGNCPEW